MALSTYSALKTAIGTWLHRSDLTGSYDEFIDLTEGMLKRAPQTTRSSTIGGIRANLSTETGTLTAADNTLTPVATYLEIVSFTLTTGGTEMVVEYAGHRQLDSLRGSGSGLPTSYTIRSGIEFNISPDSAYPYTMEYYPDFTALSDSNTTNWVLLNYPEAYLAGCMYHANRFVQNEAEATVWLQQYKNTAWGATQQYQRQTLQAGSIKIRSTYS